MASFSSFADFNRELALMAEAIEGAKKRKITGAMAEKAQRIAASQVASDLTNSDFSGWTPSSPIKLETRVKFGRDNSAILQPTRPSAGPFTVLELGRNRGNASGFSGPGINTRTGMTSRNKDGGVRKQRARKAKRWNGYTDGKSTSTKAVAAIDAAMPAVAEKGIRQVMVRHFDVS